MQVRTAQVLLLLCVGLSASAAPVTASTGEVRARLDADLAIGRPVVVHVIVALCDNEHQGIVPVPEHLGDGLDPTSNLYWGALYGVRTHMKRAGWSLVEVDAPRGRDVLERVVLSRTLDRDGSPVEAYVVADAWRGDRMQQALEHYLALSSGREAATIEVRADDRTLRLQAGGDAHLLVWVGHNGLMDTTVRRVARYSDAKPRAGMVLACLSKDYFTEHFRDVGIHPVLLTTGTMAPEAYTLDAAIRAWVETGDTERVLDQAGAAYHAYQKCGERAARRLFWGVP